MAQKSTLKKCAFLFTNIKMYVKLKLARYYGELKHISFMKLCN